MTSTPPGGRPVDLDTLADYLEGTLPADQIPTIEVLVHDDPAWASTLAALQAAQPRVAASLSGYAAENGPMPVDVASRLDDALRALERPSNVVPLAPRRRSRTSSALHNGWLQAAAVIVLAFAGFGLLIHTAAEDHGASESSAKSAAGAAAPQNGLTSGLLLTASGRDYSAATLGEAGNPSGGSAVPQPFPAHSDKTRAPSFTGPNTINPDSVPAALQPLLDPAALDRCVTAIESTIGGDAVRVDYATYQHQPALIVTLATVGTTVAVGPTCGQPGSGADIIGRN